MKRGQVALHNVPHNPVVDSVVAVDQDISECDDPSILADVGDYRRIGLTKPIQRFTDDFKLPFDTRLQQCIRTVLLKVFIGCEPKNVLCRLAGVFEVLFRFKPHITPFG